MESRQSLEDAATAFQRPSSEAVAAENRLEYLPSWLSEDNHVWITFEVHRRLMQDRFMEFCAEVRHVGGSSGFRPFVPQMVPSPINVAPPDDIAMADITLWMIRTMTMTHHVIARRKTRTDKPHFDGLFHIIN
ncbi:hypothetical protein PIB30_104378 [Stylosanthes scabra]|uniref:Uncharacterized protein n=1 Tax=Stylosanthes scabra TaxID=79078 RepID=A0ABU6QYJ3_9FABA|nr:hypothetical protein [Stylosanthes scabra]